METMDNSNKENKRLKVAGFGKRSVAFLFDFGIMGILSMVLWNTVGAAYVLPALGNQTVVGELYSYAEDSGLFYMSKNEEGETVGMAVYSYVAGSSNSNSDAQPQDDYGYKLYLEKSFTAFTEFLPGDERVSENITVTVDGEEVTYTKAEYCTGLTFGVSYLGLPDPSTVTPVEGVYTDDLIDDSNHYFRWALDSEGNIDTEAMPVLTSAAEAGLLTGSTLGELRNVFYNSETGEGVYVDIVNTTIAEPYYTDRYNSWLFNSWAALAVFYLPLAFLTFMVIPLCFPDGQTLGKKLLGLAVIKKDGYAIGWFEHIMHPLLVFVVVGTASMIPFNYLNQYISLLMFMMLAVIDYMFAFLSKGRNLSLHDRLSGTMVIDARASIWFTSPEAEQEYEKSHSTLRPKTGFFDESSKQEIERVALEDSILDLSTIDRHRKEAAAITSFDEFEEHGVDITGVELDKKEEE